MEKSLLFSNEIVRIPTQKTNPGLGFFECLLLPCRRYRIQLTELNSHDFNKENASTSKLLAFHKEKEYAGNLDVHS